MLLVHNSTPPNPEDPYSVWSFRAVVWGLHKYLTPGIIVIGLLGNMTSFAVFVGTRLRGLSSSVYLAALALADTGFLLQLFVTWLSYVRVFIFHREGWCQTFVYLTYVCSFLSVWYVVGFTVERYIAVCYPLKRHDMCTSLRAKKVVIFLALFAFAAYSFGAWTSGLVHPALGEGAPRCQPLPEYRNLVNILNNIDTVITLIIPSISIFVLNVRIATKIKYFYAKRMGMTASQQVLHGRLATRPAAYREACTDDASPDSGDEGGKTQTTALRQRSQITITKMLLVVSTMFLLLNMPSHAIRVHDFLMSCAGQSYVPPLDLVYWQQVFQMVYYCNFSINFFLYSVCGKNFRKALCRLFGYYCRGLSVCRSRKNPVAHPRRMQRRQDSTSQNTMRSLMPQTSISPSSPHGVETKQF